MPGQDHDGFVDVPDDDEPFDPDHGEFDDEAEGADDAGEPVRSVDGSEDSAWPQAGDA